jgi:S-adenosylmethionine:tRNA ribosyltransferase-isomerase
MRTDLFDFDLPDGNIALHPVKPRDAARMLVVPAQGPFEDRIVRDLPGYFRAGDVLVINESRVIPAALEGVRPARPEGEDVAVKLNLIERLDEATWRAFAKPGRRLRPGDSIQIAGPKSGLSVEVLEKGEGGIVTVRLIAARGSVQDALCANGMAPLPPYIADRREYSASDATDYQTIYAAPDGASVAAPTAGLHFTPELMSALEAQGVQIVRVCLHVGAGTFLPVKADETSAHVMHSEQFEISNAAADAINAAKADGRRVTAVGTTSLRALESAASGEQKVAPGPRDTDIFITPGYRFKIVDRLMTNFHLPRSTLFMLVSAFSGLETMQRAYRHAIAEGYRFYSYGDASLLERADG